MKREWEKKDSGHGKESVGTYYFIFVVCSLTRTGESKRKKKRWRWCKILFSFHPTQQEKPEGGNPRPRKLLISLGAQLFYIYRRMQNSRQTKSTLNFVRPCKTCKILCVCVKIPEKIPGRFDADIIQSCAWHLSIHYKYFASRDVHVVVSGVR